MTHEGQEYPSTRGEIDTNLHISIPSLLCSPLSKREHLYIGRFYVIRVTYIGRFYDIGSTYIGRFYAYRKNL
jgi:hypothetical protein